jgi:hypothetical protein
MRVSFLATLISSLMLSTSAFAQTVVEESQPPSLQGEQLLRLPGLSAFDPADASDESLGVNLKSIKIVSAPGHVTSQSITEDGIDFDAIVAPYVG